MTRQPSHISRVIARIRDPRAARQIQASEALYGTAELPSFLRWPYLRH